MRNSVSCGPIYSKFTVQYYVINLFHSTSFIPTTHSFCGAFSIELLRSKWSLRGGEKIVKVKAFNILEFEIRKGPRDWFGGPRDSLSSASTKNCIFLCYLYVFLTVYIKVFEYKLYHHTGHLISSIIIFIARMTWQIRTVRKWPSPLIIERSFSYFESDGQSIPFYLRCIFITWNI